MYQALGIALAGAIIIGLLLFIAFYLGFRAGGNTVEYKSIFKPRKIKTLEPIIRTDEDEQELEAFIEAHKS